jgi:hypothetical protein
MEWVERLATPPALGPRASWLWAHVDLAGVDLPVFRAFFAPHQGTY